MTINIKAIVLAFLCAGLAFGCLMAIEHDHSFNKKTRTFLYGTFCAIFIGMLIYLFINFAC